MLNVIVHRIKNQIEFRKQNYFIIFLMYIDSYTSDVKWVTSISFQYKKKYPSYFQSVLLLFV